MWKRCFKPQGRLPLQFAAGLVLACLAATASAQSPVSGGYQEVVFSVSSIEDYQQFFEQVAGWETVANSELDSVHLARWALKPEVTAQQVVLKNPGTQRGYVRLLKFRDVPQQQIRSNAQSWDTGGWFDVNTRVLSMAQKFAQLQSRGWQAGSDPVEFGFGPFVVQEWLARGPDGIVIALIERVQPPLEGWPHLKQMSRFFNATQIVPDIAEARAFYMEKLGFESYLEHNAPSSAPGPNVLGMPYNVAAEVPRIVSIIHPQGVNEGSVELLQYNGLTGADWSDRARPPNLGILMLRFPVTNMAAFYRHAVAQELDIMFTPVTVPMPPYGQVSVMAVRGPGGAWLEFFQSESGQ